MPASEDSVVRTITSNPGFRVFAARTTETVRGVVQAQQAGPDLAQHLGDLTTAAILLRTTMAPALRVQCILRGAGGSGTMVADSHPSGATRGLIQLPADAELRLGGDAVLQAMRTLHDGRISQGLVRVPEGGTISRAFMAYMQESEQTVTMAAFATVLDAASVAAAGGYLVQLLPDAPRRALRLMTERLERFGELAPRVAHPDFDPEELLAELLGDTSHEPLERTAVRFECWCDEVRVVSALASLSRSDVEDLISSGNVIEVSCDYCGREYRIPPAKLRGLVDRS